MFRKPCILLALFCLFLQGCSTFSKTAGETNRLFVKHEFLKAAEQLKPMAEKDSDDQLVYLLEYGTALHYAGKYEESNRAFLKADKLSEIKDYTSLSREAGALLLNEGMVQYKGEDYEKVLINAYLAMNFLFLNELDDAVVEARRLNEKLRKYKQEAKRNYQQNAFARYISAMAYEDQKNWDSAYIDYKNTYDLTGGFKLLEQDLIRAAKRARRMDDYERWKDQFGEDINSDAIKPDYGEIVLIYEQGNGPRKYPNPEFARLPKLYPQSSRGSFATLVVDGVGEARTNQVYDLSTVAIKTLDDAYAGMVAKRMAGIATKAVVADQVRQKNGLLGDLLWIGMNLADQADLRQWSTLPETLQVARLWVRAGQYTVRVKTLDPSHQPTGENMEPLSVKVLPKRKTFVNWRSFQ